MSLVRFILHVLTRGVDRHAFAVLCVLVWGAAVASPLITTLTVPKVRTGVDAEQVSSPLAATAAMGLNALVLGWALVVAVRHRRGFLRPGLPLLLLALAPWFLVVGADLYEVTPPSLRMLVYPSIVLTVFLLRPRVEALATFGYLVAGTAALCVCLALAWPAQGMFHSADGTLVAPAKAFLPIGLVVGVFSHPNTLGVFAVLGIASATQIRRRSHRFAAMALIALAALGSQSRTSLMALAAAAVIVVIVGMTAYPLRRFVAVALLSALAAVTGMLPLLTRDPAAFTNRGYIWKASLDIAADAGPFGLGPRWYTDIGRTVRGLGPTVFHGHNQYVHALVTGGVVTVGVLVTLAFVTALAAGRLARKRSLVGVGFLSILFVLCWFEVPFSLVEAPAVTALVALNLATVLFDPQGLRAQRVVAEAPVAQNAPEPATVSR